MALAFHIRYLYDFDMDLKKALATIKRAKWTQQQVANYTGLKQASISRFYSGKQTPRYGTFCRLVELAEILGKTQRSA